MQDFFVVFLDIDGTVYCKGEICEANRAAIAKARAAGHKIYINTARPLVDIPPAIRAAHWDGYVAGVGCSVIVEGQKLLSASLPLKELAQTFDRLTQAGCPVRVESERIMLCNRFYPDPETFTAVENGAQLLRDYAEEPLAKVFLPCVLPKSIREELADKYQFFQHQSYAEFSVSGLNKATGMQCVLDTYGTDTAHCIAMGDSINDLDMLRAAGISVAMGDASPEVKAVCSYISCDGADGGVGQALTELLHL